MTIQLAVANAYGIAMASDRHVFRGGEARSTGQEPKLIGLRGRVPAAMMASGPFAVFGLPVSRLSLRIERALVGAEGPEALAERVLQALEAPLSGPPRPADPEADARILAEAAQHVVGRALDHGGRRPGLERVLAELDAMPRCRGGEALEALGLAAWQASAARLNGLVSQPEVADALREAPELCGRAVVGALARDWRRSSELFLAIGLCCPDTGVPVLISLRLWRGIGQRLQFASRLDGEYEAVWKASRTVIVAQGSGRALVEALVDGMAASHFDRLPAAARAEARPGLRARWDSAHDRLAVSSPRELAAVATGLVRGAEVVGYLTREDEGTVSEIDCLLLTPRVVAERNLGAGAELVPA